MDEDKIGRTYISAPFAIAGTLVHWGWYRGQRHAWLDLGDCCTLVPLSGLIRAGTWLPEDEAPCYRNARRFARRQTSTYAG